jgi:hypothetical protein
MKISPSSAKTSTDERSTNTLETNLAFWANERAHLIPVRSAGRSLLRQSGQPITVCYSEKGERPSNADS